MLYRRLLNDFQASRTRGSNIVYQQWHDCNKGFILPGKASFLDDELNTDAWSKSAMVHTFQVACWSPDMRSEKNFAS